MTKIKVNIRPRSAKNKRPKGPTPIGRLIRAAGNAGGSYLGGLFGHADLGGATGHQLGAMASRWLGFGDYQVARNSILTKSADSVPYMHKADQSIVLRHREFVGTVTSTQNFTVQYQLPLNPGMTTFPWLASIAAKFQEYKFRGAVFHYIPASGAAISGTNSALGTIMMQTTYRASDSAPASKVEMLNEYCANEVVPSESAIHPIECDPKQNPFSVQYVRTASVPSGESVLNYDLGKTFLATQGQQADGNYLGDLWVTYEIELSKPTYSSNVTASPLTTLVATGATTSNYFTTPGAIVNDIGVIFSGFTITFPAFTGSRFALSTFFSDSNVSAATWDTATVTNGTINWSQADTVISGAAQLLCVCGFTKIDPSKPSVLTLPHMTGVTGTVNTTATTVVRFQ